MTSPQQPDFFQFVDDAGSPVLQLRPSRNHPLRETPGAELVFMLPGEPWRTVYLSADRLAALIAALQRQQVVK